MFRRHCRLVCCSYPFWSRESLVRRSIKGVSSLRTLSRANCIPVGCLGSVGSFLVAEESRSTLVMAAFQKPCSHHGSCRRNFSRAYTSCNEFWMGVPVTHQRQSAFNAQHALATRVEGFLMQCASSRITRCQSYDRRPRLLAEFLSIACISP